MLPVIIGLFATLAIAGACILGFVVLRQRMLPVDPLRTNLPPSGARPWSRFRQGSMHGSTNVYNEQILANTALPFGGAASWAVHTQRPEQGMNPAQASQPVPFTQAQPQRGFSSSLPLSPQAQPHPQMPPNGGFSQAQPFMPMPPNRGFSQSQPYPQMPPNGGYSAPEPLFPQQPFPQQPFPQQSFPQQPFPQQGFPSMQPNAGFYPANMGNNDMALAFDSANTPSTGIGNIARQQPPPSHLPETDSSRTEDIPGMPKIPETPRPGLETNSGKFSSLDDPFLRDTLNHYMQRGKGTQDGEEWEER